MSRIRILSSTAVLLASVAFASGAYAAPANVFTDAAVNSNQARLGASLDASVNAGTSSANLNTFQSNFAAQTPAAQAVTLDRLSPSSYSILPDVVLQANETTDSTIRKYLRDTRAGGSAGADPNQAQGSYRKLGGFLVGTGSDGRLKGRGDRGSVDYGAVGVMGGLDYRLNPKTLIGVMGGYNLQNYRLNPESPNSRARTWFGGAYGTVSVGPLYVDLNGSYGWTHFRNNRNVVLGDGIDDNVSYNTARYYGGSAVTGLSFDVNGFELEPYGGARYVNVHVRSLNEAGSGLTSLSVGPQNLDSLQSLAGLRIGADYTIGGAKIRPSIRGEWRHEFHNGDDRLITASFNGNGADTPFTYVSTPLGRDYAVVGAGVTISGSAPVSLVLDYTGQYFGGYKVSSGQVGLRFGL